MCETSMCALPPKRGSLSSCLLYFAYYSARCFFHSKTFESKKRESSYCVFFRIVSATLWSLAVPCEIWNPFFDFYKEATCDPDEDCVESVDQFRRYRHLNSIKFSDP